MHERNENHVNSRAFISFGFSSIFFLSLVSIHVEISALLWLLKKIFAKLNICERTTERSRLSDLIDFLRNFSSSRRKIQCAQIENILEEAAAHLECKQRIGNFSAPTETWQNSTRTDKIYFQWIDDDGICKKEKSNSATIFIVSQTQFYFQETSV